MVANKAPFSKVVHLYRKAAGLNFQQVEKGKGKWIRKIRSKPTWIPSPSGGICIGERGSDKYFLTSSEDTSSSGDETAGRGEFIRGVVGECSKVNGPVSPVEYGLQKDNPVKGMNGLQVKGMLPGLSVSPTQGGLNDLGNIDI